MSEYRGLAQVSTHPSFRTEQIAYLKVWLGILVVTDFSLLGWLASSISKADMVLPVVGIVAAIVTTIGVFLIHRRITRRIDSLRGL